MFKKIGVLAIGLSLAYVSHAQITIDSTSDDREPQIIVDKKDPNYRKQKKPTNIFFGGGLALGGGSGGSSVGVNPVVGFSPNQYWDLGLGVNFNYNSISGDYSFSGSSEKWTNYGLGPFARFNPIDWLFVQAQFEQNWGRYKNGDYKANINASSLIGSIGYRSSGEGRSGYFMSIGMDFLKNKYSPYRDVEIDNQGNVIKNSPMPIIRGGVFFYLR
ncbi:MAG: hypothetical protein DI598_03790 [Pseudopedobacter saltans]|uniref:Outer membrane protein beta-barrel domain-containing protein n=1 Tax=Pseudopedobacter saltans TaxID=151895 RepID=A0A2W5F6Z5_9SPHI|nr:MAG: hypothetical protein DI598_03790 [Pseudopedobacter saltans]